MNPESPNQNEARSGDAWFTPWRFAAILVVFICAAYPDVLFGRNTFFFRDYGYFGYPLAHYHRESFWRGELPLWNPLNNCGLPFLAQWNTLALYPGALFYLLLPLPWSLGIFCLGHLLLAGLGMYGLAHHWTGNRLAASVAGLAFAFNGLMLNCLMWPNNIAAMCWMPMVVLLVERGWREGGRMMVAGALVGAVQMLAGAPEVILFTWFLVGMMALCQWIANPQSRGATLRRFIFITAMVAGLSSAQLLPFFDLLRHSQRSQSFADTAWAMPETGWANFLVPAFHTYLNRQEVIFQYGQYWTSSYYLGIGTLAVAVFAALRVRDRRVWFLVGITLLSLILALGDDGHLYRWLRVLVPQLGFMRYPIKFVVLAVFCLPFLAAFGVRELQKLPSQEINFAWRTTAMIWAVFLALTVAIVWFDYYFYLVGENWSDTWRSGLSRMAFLTLILGTVYALRRVESRQTLLLAQLGLLVLLGMDVLTHAPRQNPTIERAALEPGLLPLRQLNPLPRHGQSRAMLTLQADMMLRYTATSVSRNDYIVSRLGLFSNCNLLEDIPKLNGFYSLYVREAEEVRALMYDSTNGPLPALYDFLGVAQITAPGKYFDWTNRSGYLPMATAGQKPVFADDQTAQRGLTKPDFNPRQIVYLPSEARSSVSATNAARARIVSSEYTGHRVSLEVDAEEPTVLVLAQAYYHPWRAFVDGQPQRILRANHGYQAVAIPKGRHAVRFRYEDRAFLAGAILGACALLICIFVWLRNPRKVPPAEPANGAGAIGP